MERMTNIHIHPTPADAALVIGASGTTGSRVTRLLREAGRPVHAAHRSGGTHFDWHDEATWGPALDGVDRAYITFSPDLALPGAAETVGRFADLAVSRGTTRLVLLSGRGEEGAQHAERLVRQSGADWTIVRCAFFAQNFDGPFADAVRAGVLPIPAGSTVEPFLDADDIAEVAAVALTDDRHIGEVYELTGPKLLSFDDVAAELSAATGRPIRYVPASIDEFAAGLHRAGYPADDASAIAELIAEVLDGRNAYLADGVQRALDREPRDFRSYAIRTAHTGVWSARAVAS